MTEIAGHRVLWTPHPGPQTRFLQAREFEVLYGGAAGGGKSDALLFGMTRQYHLRGFRGLILRTAFPDLTELVDRSIEVYPDLGGEYNDQKHRWTFAEFGSHIEFGYFSKWKDKVRYRGQQFSEVGWDELGECPEERFWLFMMTRCRSGAPGITPSMRASANPGGAGHAWIKRRFIDVCGTRGERTYTDPKTRLQRRFIPSRVTDNPTLLRNNPQYVPQLHAQPELLRRQLLEGDWEAGIGTALDELNEHKHLMRSFPIPEHWKHFGGFDWGYDHRWVFQWWTVNEDGSCFCVETVSGRRERPDVIIAKVAERVPIRRLDYIAGGLDLWHKHVARGENTPTLSEQFTEAGWPLQRANVARIHGLQNLRRFVAWRGMGPEGIDDDPRARWLITPGNRRSFEALQGMVTAPADPEDVMKVDVDESGEGGDDDYDCTRYALASRPAPSGEAINPDLNLNDPLSRAIEASAQRKVARVFNRGPMGAGFDHPDLGGYI